MSIQQFTTERLSVRDWQATIDDRSARPRLEKALTVLLTQAVVEHLPPPLQLHGQKGGVSAWVDARAEESDVLLVERRHGGDLIGLMLIAREIDSDDIPTLHIGYLLAEAAWGQGFASELVTGFVCAAQGRPLRLVGGVDGGNPASARVLEKAGFVMAPELSTSESDIYVRYIT
ncbi:GNAT family N-acetyltransferase [Celeribacter arenosi]|uniref:GNAT family N-acetyltransferase n=1 Tax=Celeribacter arenosi TaxID=792649 RepID=A0ABP7JW11_9RHOB